MKGIILAAGRGTRMYPMTKPVCKPLLPVYDKPMIYYPLSALIQAGISEVLIIVPQGEESTFSALLGDGSQWGMQISYCVQPVARGIADALLISEEFQAGDSVCLALGDNIFYSPSLPATLKKAAQGNVGATVFGYYVDDPQYFGVVELDSDGKAVSIEEKPRFPKSHYVIPGLYFYHPSVVEIAKNLTFSPRGELEITDVNLEYLRRDQLKVVLLDQDFVWLDAGSADSLLAAAQSICDIQKTGKYISCIEEAARDEGLITTEQVHEIGRTMSNTNYGKYLLSL